MMPPGWAPTSPPAPVPRPVSVFGCGCLVTGACPSSASPSTWRSPVRRLRPRPRVEGWPAQCPRSRSRWSRTTTRTSTTSGPGTWAVRPRYKKTAEVSLTEQRALCGQTPACSQCWPAGGARWLGALDWPGQNSWTKCSCCISDRCCSEHYIENWLIYV